jgi:hypothetical protein
VVAAGGVGLVAYLSLALASPASAAAALLCMLGNLSHALPDVMIDASVAVRCKSVRSRVRSTDNRPAQLTSGTAAQPMWGSL